MSLVVGLCWWNYNSVGVKTGAHKSAESPNATEDDLVEAVECARIAFLAATDAERPGARVCLEEALRKLSAVIFNAPGA